MLGSDNGVNRATVIRHVAFDDDDDDDDEDDAGLQKEKQDHDLVYSFLDDDVGLQKEKQDQFYEHVFSFSFPLFFSFAAVKSL